MKANFMWQREGLPRHSISGDFRLVTPLSLSDVQLGKIPRNPLSIRRISTKKKPLHLAAKRLFCWISWEMD